MNANKPEVRARYRYRNQPQEYVWVVSVDEEGVGYYNPKSGSAYMPSALFAATFEPAPKRKERRAMNDRTYSGGTYPLVDIEREELGIEWAAALYESWTADYEWHRGDTAVTRPVVTDPDTWREMHPELPTLAEYGDSLASLTSYGRAAERAAEDIERSVYDRWSYRDVF